MPPPPMLLVGHAHHDFDLMFGTFYGFNWYTMHHADTNYSEEDSDEESDYLRPDPLGLGVPSKG
jgi:hypothetical protein